jgi:tRNA (mo5U34)-methyltransferase
MATINPRPTAASAPFIEIVTLDTAASLGQQIETLGPWFHNLHLPDGTQTAPGHSYGDFPSFKWQSLAAAVPQDLRGWSVLDIGCNAGFYSIELARRGARVFGMDVEPLYLKQAQWAARQFPFQDRLSFIEGDVYDLLSSNTQYDLVWFTGVFYHLRYPTLALDLVRRVAGDASNSWAPNPAGVEALLRSAGFQVLSRPEHEFYVCKPAVIAAEAAKDLQRLKAVASGSPR